MKKQITLGLLTIAAITTPIVTVMSCKNIMGEGNQDQSFKFDYSKDSKSSFDKFIKTINESWKNRYADTFLITVTNKQHKSKDYSFTRKKGDKNKDSVLQEIKQFLSIK